MTGFRNWYYDLLLEEFIQLLMHKWMHGNQTLVGCMDERLCIVMKVDCVGSRKASNAFKVIRVSGNEVLAGVEWRKG